jgi:murein DD-endopeptidase MepM/ murein hydrolase activator NlpD
MNRLQVLFLVLLIGFVALVWLGTGRVPTPKVVESVSFVVQPLPQITPTTQITRIDQGLIIPVAGVRSDQLVDTFTESRAEGRTHDAIDIIAPADTPVLAAADGTITKLWQSERGGTTIYQLTADRKMIFYYAHLARYADGLTEGKQVRQGEVIAYVGDTGNAGPGNYHLHFSIAIVSDPKRYWEGTNINPYPLLHK